MIELLLIAVQKDVYYTVSTTLVWSVICLTLSLSWKP